MSQAVNNAMIQLARESRGLTQGLLAKETSISQGHISKFERGELQVSGDQLAKIAKALNYPKSFFYRQTQLYGFGVSYIHHRKRQSLPALALRKIQAQFNIWTIEIRELLQHVKIQCDNEFYALDIDDFNGDARHIAELVRAQWRLPLGPVNNMISTIESAGGIVIKCELTSRKFDAQSQWFKELPPIFFINKDIPSDRLRFTLAHEIGHVIMHRYPTNNMEDEANQFASEFLMPRREILPDLTPFSLERALRLKLKWKVSIAALIMRAFDLGVITKSQKQRYFTQLSAAGYRTTEPVSIPDETPSIIHQLIKVCQCDHGYSIVDLCRMLSIYEKEFRVRYLSMPPLRIARF